MRAHGMAGLGRRAGADAGDGDRHDLIVELRSATAGVGTFTAKFDHLAELTGRLADQVLASHKQAAE